MNKQDLVKYLADEYLGDGITHIKDNSYGFSLEEIADFIIEREKRILEPLVKQGLKPGTSVEVSLVKTAQLCKAIEQTLALSGLEG